MNATFRKATLKVGTYHSPDGSVTVTPSRLKHWEQGFRRLSARYQVPMHFGHGELTDLEMLSPIPNDIFFGKKSRSARLSEGRLTGFTTSPDGQSAEITVEAMTPGSAEKMHANTVFVSPVLFPEFVDGAGVTHKDVITAVDLVDYPVDFSQGPFVPTAQPQMLCAIRMGLSKPFIPGVIRMGTDFTPPAGDPPSDGAPPAPQADGSGLVAAILQAFQAAGMPLPEGTNETNIADAITAVLGGGGTPSNVQEVASPEIQTMSLRLKTAETEATAAKDFAQRIYQASLSDRLRFLQSTGRCTVDEFNAKRLEVDGVRLSLSNEGRVLKEDSEKWIESREAIPPNTFGKGTGPAPTGESTLRRMSVVEPKADTSTGMTTERADELAGLFRK